MTEEEKIDRTPVAQDIWCWSTKEKAYTWHVVVNHDAQGYVDRVQCKVSKSVHKYKRLAKSAAVTTTRSSIVRKAGQAAAAKSAAALATSSAALEDVWFRGIKKWGEKAVPSFDPKATFSEGEVINHVTFGKGVVQRRRDNKIDVLFRAGVKVLPSPK